MSKLLFASRRLRGVRTVLLLTALLCVSGTLRADTITVNDLTSTLTLTHIGTNRLVTYSCGLIGTSEGCTFAITGIGVTIKSTIGGGQPVVAIADPGGKFVSDLLTMEGVTAGSQVLTGAFISLADGATPVACAPPVPCTITENGKLQTALTVTWSNNTTDTIRFKSDIESVPEPSSILLLLTGLAPLGMWIRRRRVAAHSSQPS